MSMLLQKSKLQGFIKYKMNKLENSKEKNKIKFFVKNKKYLQTYIIFS